MTKPNDYFYNLLQARGSVTTLAQKEIDRSILSYLEKIEATVDYSYVEPEVVEDTTVKGDTE